MSDGTRIALDLWLPAEAARSKIPTVFRPDRYRRSLATGSSDPANKTNADEAEFWAGRGYALVVVDARGTGASFGTRSIELGTREIDDYAELLDWIADQEWSNGRVGAYGISYRGDAAELMARTGNQHLTAVAPPGSVTSMPSDSWSIRAASISRARSRTGYGPTTSLTGSTGQPSERLN